MRASILAFVGGLALMTSAQAAPLGPTSMPAANVITVQGWPTGSGARRVDQARARSTNGASIVGGFGIKSTRFASAYLTLRLGREAEHHLWEVREQLRGECRGTWRDGD
jgi:hypothetical protein